MKVYLCKQAYYIRAAPAKTLLLFGTIRFLCP